MVVDPTSTSAPPGSTVGSATTVRAREGERVRQVPDRGCIVGREPGHRRKRAFVQSERPRHGLAAGIDGEHRLPSEQRLQQIEGELGHRTLERAGTLFVGRACRIHRTTQGGECAVDMLARLS